MSRLKIAPPSLLVGLVLVIYIFSIKPQIASAKEVRQYTIEEFLETTNYFGTTLSPDNRKILVSSDESGIYNVYAIPIDGSQFVQLTDSTKESFFGVSYFPNDERFLYASDKGGNELDHLYVQELDGTVKDLTPGEEVRAIFQRWAHDEKSFFVSTNERDKRYLDIYEYSVENYERRMIFQNDAGYIFADISPDKQFLALAKTQTRDDSDIYLYDLQSSEMTHLTPHEGNINHFPQGFSVDNARLSIREDRVSGIASA